MTLWRLEWLRLVRTRRWLVLVALFVLTGLTGPLLAQYAEQLAVSAGVPVDLPPPTPADGIAQFTKSVAQLGVLAVVVVAAAALALDANPQIAAFLRTRTASMRPLLLSRVVVTAAAAVVSFALGLLAAAYETLVLLGALPLGPTLLGSALVALYLVFVVCVTAVVASLARGLLPTVLGTVAVLLLLPSLALIDVVGPWLPSELLGALDALLRAAEPSRFARPAGVAAVGSVLSVCGAWRIADRREL